MHHVAECALEHGLPHQKRLLVNGLRKDLMRNSRNRNAAYVVEKALLYGSPEDRHTLAADLLSYPGGELSVLARSQFGSMVVRALLRSPEEITRQVQEHIRSTATHIKGTKHGRRLLNDHDLGIGMDAPGS